MSDVPFSHPGFLLGTAVLVCLAVFATIAVVRWNRGNPERQRLFGAFALGHVVTVATAWLGAHVYFPLFFWLAGKLGL